MAVTRRHVVRKMVKGAPPNPAPQAGPPPPNLACSRLEPL